MGQIENRNDLGVVVALSGDGSGTYVNVKGASAKFGALGGTYIGTDSGDGIELRNAGRAKLLRAQVSIARVHATTVYVKLQSRRKDLNNPTLFTTWCDVQTRRGDTGNIASEQQFTGSGAEEVQLQTPDAVLGAVLSGELRMIVKASNDGNPLASGDKVIIGLDWAP